MKGILIASGELFDRDSLMKELRETNFVVCIDGGTNYAYELDIKPNMIIGDMDSIDGKILESYRSLNIPFRLYPRDKDKTDFHLAIEEIERLGIRDISIYGIVGTRLDHTLSALGIIRKYVREKRLDLVKISLGRNASGYIARDRIKIYGEPGDTVSIIPLTELVSSITTYNLKYPLNGEDIYIEDSLTVSNEIENSPCWIEFREGIVLVTHYRLK